MRLLGAGIYTSTTHHQERPALLTLSQYFNGTGNTPGNAAWESAGRELLNRLTSMQLTGEVAKRHRAEAVQLLKDHLRLIETTSKLGDNYPYLQSTMILVGTEGAIVEWSESEQAWALPTRDLRPGESPRGRATRFLQHEVPQLQASMPVKAQIFSVSVHGDDFDRLVEVFYLLEVPDLASLEVREGLRLVDWPDLHPVTGDQVHVFESAGRYISDRLEQSQASANAMSLD